MDKIEVFVNKSPGNEKYIGLWSVCNQFWCNNWLYANKIMENSMSKG